MGSHSACQINNGKIPELGEGNRFVFRVSRFYTTLTYPELLITQRSKTSQARPDRKSSKTPSRWQLIFLHHQRTLQISGVPRQSSCLGSLIRLGGYGFTLMVYHFDIFINRKALELFLKSESRYGPCLSAVMEQKSDKGYRYQSEWYTKTNTYLGKSAQIV